MTTALREHPFQAAGLGLAPFRCIGHEHKVGPLRYPGPDGTTLEIGAPGQPMGTCDYCGTGIADCYVIKSRDGKRFIVGSDCVARTYRECGETVPTDVERQIAEVRRERAAARREVKRLALVERFKAARDLFASLPVESFTGEPHPYGYTDRASGRPLTRRDFLEYQSRGCSTENGMRQFCDAVEGAAAVAGVVIDRDALELQRAQEAARIEADRVAALEVARIRTATLAAHWRAVVDVLNAAPGSFAPAMAEKLMTEGRAGLSDRAFDIVADIVAKAAGRRGSAKYATAHGAVSLLADLEPAAAEG